MTASYQPSNALGNFLPEQVWLSDDLKTFQSEIKRLSEDHARMINRKDTGQYELIEGLINQQYFGATPQNKRQIYRRVFQCGALPNAGIISIAHGIAGINANWMFTRIYGVARDPVGLRWIPIPNSINFQVELSVDNVNINIRTTANLTAFTYTIVVLEYWKL